MVDGRSCMGKFLLGVSSTWSPVSSSRRTTSSQLGLGGEQHRLGQGEQVRGDQRQLDPVALSV